MRLVTVASALLLGLGSITVTCWANAAAKPQIEPPIVKDPDNPIVVNVPPQFSRLNGNVQLGPRPFFLLDDMAQSPLKEKLKRCKRGVFHPSKFSIGHRGAPMQFPEHTRESYVAAAKMGAGIVECDVTFTQDRELVCRHSQCDLHSTTNILATPLADKCAVPPLFDVDGKLANAADIQCCTSDITLAEFKSLQGKMDAANLDATSIEEYMNATADWRTDIYTGPGTLLTHAESIVLLDSLDVDFTPELKSPSVPMPFEGDYTQQQYASQMINEYVAAGIHPKRVWPQSFNYADVIYWINQHSEFSQQAVLLDGVYDTHVSQAKMQQWVDQGVRVLAPPMWMLLDVNAEGAIVPSQYALNAQAVGLKLITWTLERSGLLKDNGGWYYQSLNGDTGGLDVIHRDGDTLEVLHVLANDVGVIGVFSDWPATTTFYANCMGK
ncbi:glycerophosphodiester phosphodiesterase family protein [Corallincola spongiicola]|uniref:glycerophosphodiester phosphodiesterase n=1 Tax=Corallincola spongiicola TaxID=2520508 RepID=A0ABY1WS20_9GAMM|nr:glycerophosphodiester phosphodiesterase family protein [Corallincola spongiicola]TAA47532.1 glycerophosphodiester phosphodiesterase [Corallincola spongiicola]